MLVGEFSCMRFRLFWLGTILAMGRTPQETAVDRIMRQSYDTLEKIYVHLLNNTLSLLSHPDCVIRNIGFITWILPAGSEECLDFPK